MAHGNITFPNGNVRELSREDILTLHEGMRRFEKFLDEEASNVSPSYREEVGRLTEDLAKSL